MSAAMHREQVYPYIQQLEILRREYPALEGFLNKIKNNSDKGRKHVEDAYKNCPERVPGRCVLLTFNEASVEKSDIETPEKLKVHLTSFPSRDMNDRQRCRLWILEDLTPQWVDILGNGLGVDPLVFSEQMNTWNFTDSDTIPIRLLPSMVNPRKSFTLKYYEFRQLQDRDAKSIDWMRNQTTFAVNRRRYERWRDIDTHSFRNNWRHGFIRRCASFWTNQNGTESGWDAVMLVDPPFDSFKWSDFDTALASSSPLPGCTILQDPEKYDERKKLWKARENSRLHVQRDTSTAYHGGSSTFAEIFLTPDVEDNGAKILDEEPKHDRRDLSSPLDEIVFHWTELADPDLISSARQHSVNTAHYLLAYLATHWTMQLDLISCAVAQSDYFADDHEKRINFETTSDAWKEELLEVTRSTMDMNYMKRQLNHFEQAMILNMERLDLIIGAEAVNENMPQAIKDAQMNFIAIQAKLRPFCDRIAGLSGMANELASLHMAFKSVKDSEFGLRLSLFASIIFPATLVTSLLSMGDDYLPGKDKFWVFWAAAVPLVLVFTGALLFGRKPERWVERKMKMVTESMEREQQKWQIRLIRRRRKVSDGIEME